MPEVGQALGRYTLLSRLAVGGMGEIFVASRAGPLGFGPFVALKILRTELGENSTFVDMLVDEANISKFLNHQNIVSVIDFNAEHGSYYIAMEYVQGLTLQGLLAGLKERNEKIELPVALFVAIQLSRALKYAHGRTDHQGEPLNLIHRDVTPANVLLSVQGEVKLADFGIARAKGRLQETQAGIIKGKFGYMAPEMLRHDEIDSRADLFCLGVVLYEMLAGRHPTEEASMIEAARLFQERQIEKPSKFNPEVGEALDDIVIKALEPEPDLRWATAQDLGQALMEVALLPEIRKGFNEASARLIKTMRSVSTKAFEPPVTKEVMDELFEERKRREEMAKLALDLQPSARPPISAGAKDDFDDVPPTYVPDQLSSARPPIEDQPTEPRDDLDAKTVALEAISRDDAPKAPSIPAEDTDKKEPPDFGSWDPGRPSLLKEPALPSKEDTAEEAPPDVSLRPKLEQPAGDFDGDQTMWGPPPAEVLAQAEETIVPGSIPPVGTESEGVVLFGDDDAGDEPPQDPTVAIDGGLLAGWNEGEFSSDTSEEPAMDVRPAVSDPAEVGVDDPDQTALGLLADSLAPITPISMAETTEKGVVSDPPPEDPRDVTDEQLAIQSLPRVRTSVPDPDSADAGSAPKPRLSAPVRPSQPDTPLPGLVDRDFANKKPAILEARTGYSVGPETKAWMKGEIPSDALSWSDEDAARRVVATREHEEVKAPAPWRPVVQGAGMPAPSKSSESKKSASTPDRVITPLGMPQPNFSSPDLDMPIGGIPQAGPPPARQSWMIYASVAILMISLLGIASIAFLTRAFWPRVTLTSSPTGAEVVVDGKQLGVAPLTLRIRPYRAHAVVLNLPGYNPKNLDALDLGFFANERVDVALEPAARKLFITPVGGTVFLNGVKVGEGTVVELPPLLDVGSLDLRVESEGYRTWARSFSTKNEVPPSVDVVLEAEPEPSENR